MSSRLNRVLTVCVLLSGALGYYFFAVLVQNSRHPMATRNLAAGYGYGNDLYPIWMTTREMVAHKTNPYSAAMEHPIETGLYGRPLDRQNPSDATVNYRGFSYPLYTDILAVPLALLPFRALQIAMSVLLPLIVGVGVARWCTALGVVLSPLPRACLLLVILCSCQVLEGIYALQPTLIVATLLAGVAAGLRQDRLITAGILLAIASMKPHLVVLPLLWLVVW